jgi:hypothetical protein
VSCQMFVQADPVIMRSPSRRKRTPSSWLVGLGVLPDYPATPKTKRDTAVLQLDAETPKDEASAAIAPDADPTPIQREEDAAPEPVTKKAKETPMHPPNRPDSAYGIFVGTRHGELSVAKPGMSVVERSKQIKDEWSFMSQEAQAPFRVIADAHLARYWREMEAYERERKVGGAMWSVLLTQSFLQIENAEHEQEKSKAAERVVFKRRRVRKGARLPHKHVKEPVDPREFYRLERLAELKLAYPLLGLVALRRKSYAEWKLMTTEQRAPFRAMWEADKLRFQREVDAYNAAKRAGGP